MKYLLVLLTVFASEAFSRQYIQCSDYNSWDRVVVNLDGEKSTLFMTNGVHLPPEDQIRILKDLKKYSETATEEVYKTSGETIDTVIVPKEHIGVASSYFEITLKHENVVRNLSRERQMGCFSSIHE